MTTSEIFIGLLAMVTLCGIIIFTILSLDTQVLVPVLSSLVAYLVGKKQDRIMGYLGGKR